MKIINWKSIKLFYFLACLWNWPFFWWRDLHSESWVALAVPNFLKTWSYMWGPGISAIICLYLFRHTHIRKVTFKGTSLWHGILFLAVLPSVLCVTNKNIAFIRFGILGFIAILGEELGWRGFLQDAIEFKSDYQKAIIIGVMWEIWHFTNRTANQPILNSVIRVSIWIMITSLLSFLMVKLTNRTRSLLVAVTFHMAFDAMFEFNLGWQSVLISLPIWGIIYKNWMSSQRAVTDH